MQQKHHLKRCLWTWLKLYFIKIYFFYLIFFMFFKLFWYMKNILNCTQEFTSSPRRQGCSQYRLEHRHKWAVETSPMALLDQTSLMAWAFFRTVTLIRSINTSLGLNINGCRQPRNFCCVTEAYWGAGLKLSGSPTSYGAWGSSCIKAYSQTFSTQSC